MKVTNVASHSFGVIAFTDDDVEVISNLVLAQQRLPADVTKPFSTREADAELIELKIVENTSGDHIVTDLDMGEEVGNATLEMRKGLPAGSPIEVTFELDNQGRLHITGRDMAEGGRTVTAVIETNRVLSIEEVEQAVEHGRGIRVVG